MLMAVAATPLVHQYKAEVPLGPTLAITIGSTLINSGVALSIVNAGITHGPQRWRATGVQGGSGDIAAWAAELVLNVTASAIPIVGPIVSLLTDRLWLSHHANVGAEELSASTARAVIALGAQTIGLGLVIPGVVRIPAEQTPNRRPGISGLSIDSSGLRLHGAF